MGGATHIPKSLVERYTHVCEYPQPPQRSNPPPKVEQHHHQKPHSPPLRVVTKPHTESNDNTYIEGGTSKAYPPCRFSACPAHAERFPLTVRPSRLFPAGVTPYPTGIRSGKYRAVGVAYRACWCVGVPVNVWV